MISKLALSREEAAVALGVHPATVDRLTKRGLLRPSRATRRPIYAVFEIERFLRDTSSVESPVFTQPKQQHSAISANSEAAGLSPARRTNKAENRALAKLGKPCADVSEGKSIKSKSRVRP